MLGGFAVAWPERLLSLTVACSHCGGAAAVPAAEETVRKLVAASSGDGDAMRRGLEVVAHPDSFSSRPEVLDYYQWTKQTWPHAPEEIIAFTKERIAAFKYPRHVHVLDALPTGASGKVLKRDLVSRFAAWGHGRDGVPAEV